MKGQWLGLVGLGSVLLLSGCAFQGGAKTDEAAFAAQQQRLDTVRLSRHFEQQPTEEEKQRVVEQATQQLKAEIQAKSEQDVAQKLETFPRVLKLALQQMHWAPLTLDPSVRVVQQTYLPVGNTLDVQVELDHIAWLAQLNTRLEQLDREILHFKRVPDNVNALLKLRAALPALPFLLHRIQIRKMIWRLDPSSVETKWDRMADRLMRHIVQQSRDFVIEVDTDIEKQTEFENMLSSAMVELGFELISTRPADLIIIYDLQDKMIEQDDSGFKALYNLNLKLSDAQAAPFAMYVLEVEGRGTTSQLAQLRVMQEIARDIQLKVVDYLLEEYRVFYEQKGNAL